MTTSLGQRLANKIAEEKAQTLAAQEAEARHISEVALKEFQAVYLAFEDIKTLFRNAIESGIPTQNLFVQIGGRHYAKSGLAQYYDLHDIIEGYNNKQDMPATMQGNGRFTSIWNSFKGWAAANGLDVKWQYAWDGGGMSSWWNIKLSPAAQVAARTVLATPLGVQVKTNPALALQTLAQLVDTCVELADALASAPGHEARHTLHRHARQIIEARQLKTELG